ncbi:hypothetical protein ABZV65_19565 [Streptomyces bauhiniae]|uniref:hypothetical protein n=1 Tax=Streptomyces bauhiniae TaxID=2340725 RepID=UPI0033A0FA12
MGALKNLARALSNNAGANRSAVPADFSRGNDMPASERRIVEEYAARRQAAADHYTRTGDSSRMWQEKEAQSRAIQADRHIHR